MHKFRTACSVFFHICIYIETHFSSLVFGGRVARGADCHKTVLSRDHGPDCQMIELSQDQVITGPTILDDQIVCGQAIFKGPYCHVRVFFTRLFHIHHVTWISCDREVLEVRAEVSIGAHSNRYP
jgi:hypothetical protein